MLENLSILAVRFPFGRTPEDFERAYLFQLFRVEDTEFHRPTPRTRLRRQLGSFFIEFLSLCFIGMIFRSELSQASYEVSRSVTGLNLNFSPIASFSFMNFSSGYTMEKPQTKNT